MKLNVEPEQTKPVEGTLVAPIAEALSRPLRAPSLASMNMPATASKVIQEGSEVKRDPSGKESKNDEQEIFVDLDKRDEQQIVAQLTGGYIEEFVYEYCKFCKWPGGVRPPTCTHDTIRDLSWVGIQEVTRSMSITVKKGERTVFMDDDNAIKSQIESKEDQPGITIIEWPTKVRVMVRAFDAERQIERLGIAEQPKKMRTSAGVKEDEFYLQKAMSKAERNGLRQLMPQTMIKAWIDQYLESRKGSKTKQVTGPSKPSPELEKKIQGLLELSKTKGMDLSIQQLKAKVFTEKSADYCSAQLQAGNVDGFSKFMDLKPKVIVAPQSGDTFDNFSP